MNLKLVILCMFWFGNDYLVNPGDLPDLTDTTPEDFSFFVWVETKEPEQTCGGILIADNYVITPANCVKGSSKAKVYLRTNKHDPARFQKILDSTEIFIHNDFGKLDNYLFNDIALVKLPEVVTLNDSVRPGRLITREQVQLLEGKIVNVSGIFDRKHYQVAAQLGDQDICSNIYKNHFFRSQHFCIKWFNMTNFNELGRLGNMVTMDGKIIGFMIAYPWTGDALISLFLNFSPFLKWMSDTMNIPIEQFTTHENTENESLAKLQKKLNLRLDEIEKLLREQKTFKDKHTIQEEEKVQSLTAEMKNLKARVNNITDLLYNVGSLFPNNKVNITL